MQFLQNNIASRSFLFV